MGLGNVRKIYGEEVNQIKCLFNRDKWNQKWLCNSETCNEAFWRQADLHPQNYSL